MRFRLISLAGGLLALAGLATGAMPASAVQAQFSDTVNFVGNITGMTPIPNPPAMNTTGTYTFASSHCVTNSDVEESDVPPPPTGEVDANCSISSSGTYNNITCGTESADGSATLYAEGSSGYWTGFYHITFVNGVGTLTGSGSEADSGGPADIDGTVQISPTGTSTRECATSFMVVGSGTITEPLGNP
jgi:hypothetical protein